MSPLMVDQYCWKNSFGKPSGPDAFPLARWKITFLTSSSMKFTASPVRSVVVLRRVGKGVIGGVVAGVCYVLVPKRSL
jgi:hypothetical protein